MATAQSDPGTYSEAAIFPRLWETAEGGLSPELAKHLMSVGFSARDQARMHELAAKNQDGTLTAEERDQLDGFVKVGDLLAILRSKARRVLSASKVKRTRDG